MNTTILLITFVLYTLRSLELLGLQVEIPTVKLIIQETEVQTGSLLLSV